jgi:hypothetical protein
MERVQNADALETFEGFEKDELEGQVWQWATDEELKEGLDRAFGYRGDVTLSLQDGSQVDGYVFDARPAATLAESVVRLILKEGGAKRSIPYNHVKGIAFSGRDTAAGKTWEAWVRKYTEKKALGESNIQIEPESLD